MTGLQLPHTVTAHSRATDKFRMVNLAVIEGRSIAPVQPTVSKETQRVRAVGAAMAVDLLVIAFSFAAGNLIWSGELLDERALQMMLGIAGLHLIIASSNGGLGVDVMADPKRAIRQALASIAFAVALIFVFAFMFKVSATFSRGVFALSIAIACPMLVAGRVVLARFLRRFFLDGIWRVVLIVDGFEIEPERGSHVVDARSEDVRPDIADPLMMHRLGNIVRDADRVVISCPESGRKAWAMALRGADSQVEVLAPRLLEFHAITETAYSEIPTLRISFGTLDLADRVKKRMFDLSFALAIMPVVLPLFLLVALLIKLDSRGPVFFLQPRIGRGNRMFTMLKFRSMKVEGSDREGERSTDRDDDRVTRVGRFLRKTSIDETPQILNVLLGDMSVVGPRPHARSSRAEQRLFWEIDYRYWHRHSVKPGMTGLAQVRGHRGATHKRSDLTDRLASDLEYLRGWTIWRDLRIVAATILVLSHKDAY